MNNETRLVRTARRIDGYTASASLATQKAASHVKADIAKPFYQSTTKRSAVCGALLGIGALLGAAS